MRDLIGSEAEEFVYRYGGYHRGRSWRALPSTGLTWSRFTGDSASPTPAELLAFADLNILNELNVYESSRGIAARSATTSARSSQPGGQSRRPR